jgi:hypothetical protein
MGEGMCLLSKLLHRPDHFSGLQIMKSKKSEEDKTRKLNDIFDGRNTPAFNKDIGTEVRFRTDGWEDWLDPLHDDETEDGSDIEMGTPQDAASPAHPANSRDKVKDKAPSRGKDDQSAEKDTSTSKRQHLDVETIHSKKRRGHQSPE